MGTPDFAVGTLEAILAAGHEVVAVVSQPDKAKGRKKELQPTEVKAAALAHGLTVYQPEKARDPEFVSLMRKLNPDVIVVAAFGQIIPKEILDMPRYGCLNVHASLLPKYRGAAPIQWAILDGEKEAGVTIMKMGEGLDTGDMLMKEAIGIAPDETGGSLFGKLSKLGGELLCEALDLAEEDALVAEKQPEESPTEYARMITKADGQIDWKKDAFVIERYVRGLNPWPSAYTRLGGKMLKIWKAAVSEEPSAFAAPEGSDKAPGMVLEAAGEAEGGRQSSAAAQGKYIPVQTGNGVLLILELQLEGKKRMSAEEFLRGRKVAAGTLLG